MAQDEYCPICIHFNIETGACSQLHVNVESRPDLYEKKCSGTLFALDARRSQIPMSNFDEEDSFPSNEAEREHIGDEADDAYVEQEGGFYSSPIARPFGVFMIVTTIGLTVYGLLHLEMQIANIRNLFILNFICFSVAWRIFLKRRYRRPDADTTNQEKS